MGWRGSRRRVRAHGLLERRGMSSKEERMVWEMEILPKTQTYDKDASINLSVGANTSRTCGEMLMEAADLIEQGRLTRVMVIEAGVRALLGDGTTAHRLLWDGFPDADHYPDSGIDFAAEAESVRKANRKSGRADAGTGGRET